jgi:hypothetical protein
MSFGKQISNWASIFCASGDIQPLPAKAGRLVVAA